MLNTYEAIDFLGLKNPVLNVLNFFITYFLIQKHVFTTSNLSLIFAALKNTAPFRASCSPVFMFVLIMARKS